MYYGAAILIFQHNEYTTFTNCIFNNNSADAGGALYVNIKNEFVHIINCQFRNNYGFSQGGGALYVNSGNAGVSLRNSSFIYNIAAEGGAVYAYDSNFIDISDSKFVDNIVYSGGGGALSIGLVHPNLSISRCSFVSNIALLSYGGAIALDGQYYYDMTLKDSSFRNNLAAGTHGGAIYLENVARMTFYNNSIISGIAAGYGGGIYLSASQDIFISNSYVKGNAAFSGGGGIYVDSCIDVFVINTVFRNNSALESSGSAFHLSATHNISFTGNKFISNRAIDGGGTVYWVVSGMIEPAGLSTNTQKSVNAFFQSLISSLNLQQKTMIPNQWMNNTASFGSKWATDITTVYSPDAVTVPKYSTYFPTTNVTTSDYYNQIVSTYTSHVVASVSEAASFCDPNVGFLVGSTTTAMKEGVASVTSLEGGCIPGGNLTVLYEEYTTSLAHTTTYHFPRCSYGDYYSSQQCVQCPYGKYSLIDNWNNTVVSCSSCPSDVVECYADQIVLKSGQWRISPYAATYFTCPYGEKSCIGGYSTSTGSCQTGYYGPLCSVCASGYYYSSSLNGCRNCTNDHGASLAIWILLFTSVLVLLAMYFTWAKIQDLVHSKIHNNASMWNEESMSAWTEESERTAKRQRAITGLQAKFKMIVSLLQV